MPHEILEIYANIRLKVSGQPTITGVVCKDMEGDGYACTLIVGGKTELEGSIEPKQARCFLCTLMKIDGAELSQQANVRLVVGQSSGHHDGIVLNMRIGSLPGSDSRIDATVAGESESFTGLSLMDIRRVMFHFLEQEKDESRDIGSILKGQWNCGGNCKGLLWLLDDIAKLKAHP